MLFDFSLTKHELIVSAILSSEVDSKFKIGIQFINRSTSSVYLIFNSLIIMFFLLFNSSFNTISELIFSDIKIDKYHYLDEFDKSDDAMEKLKREIDEDEEKLKSEKKILINF